MEPSIYQAAVYDATQFGKTDILVKATAGSGKTTTIVNASKLLNPGLDIAFLAFNNSIVKELKERLPETVTTSTLHSLGFRSLFKHYHTKKNFDVSEYKTSKFFMEVVKGEKKLSYEEYEKMKWTVTEILAYARLNHTPNEHKDLELICDYYGMVFEGDEINYARRVYDELFKYNEIKVSEQKSIDFVDMIYLPSYYDVKTLPKFDVVFVDEAQDLNKSQQILVEKIKKPSGRAIYVGDENQAIYMFAGADANSFNSIGRNDTVSLPLSVCYRCAKRIVREAQGVIGEDQIQPFEGQQEGQVISSTIEEIKEGDMVVCRNNSPLFSLYFDLIQRGIKAKIRGREIEKQLLKLVEKVKYSTTDEGFSKLDLMLEKIHDEQQKKGYNDPTKTKRFQNFNEMVNIIKFVAQGKNMMVEVRDELNTIFSSDKNAAELMTIHKAKGLENDRVHFLSPELLPSKWAKTSEEKKQEMNLKFVAITRAKKFLNYIRNYESRVEI